MPGKIFNSCLVFLEIEGDLAKKKKIDVRSKIANYDGVISNILTKEVSPCFY